MNKKTLVTNSMIAGAMAVALTGLTAHDADAAKDKEKCYGVVEAGHNDCGDADGDHSCMGQSTVDGAGDEWVAVPAGLCEKLVGGSLEPYEGTTPASAEDDMKKDG